MSYLKIHGLNREQLIHYITRQVDNLMPDSMPLDNQLLAKNLPFALERLRICINMIKPWKSNEFDYLHSSQYCIFLYYLANTIWQNSGESLLPTKLFNLNKALNGIDLFYEIEMPKHFFISPSVGIVLAKATYGDYLVLYQNSTIGKNHGISPALDEGVILFPNSAIIGDSYIRSNTVISQGVSVINQDTLANSIVFQGRDRELVYKTQKRNFLADYFNV